MKYSSRESDALQLHGDFQDRIVAVPHFVQNGMGLRLHRFRARIVVLVHAMAEARETEIVVLLSPS